ncbi:LacI family DNA-binding transcriptional regulator [Roseibacterium sp. SDUM158017]|uniref:LacI family DNA-binding transcriptional regulator n=1 Tax=Roseicyclus salinarum TaxID=3036773 RepID=UPI002415362E|nr:LacI family DNA-binding transcriptional regulator [Roseibacterium sp. SDUM158017]MDG4648723.1 LacI family DNA-binding transcriptional regulator [Roseibacterium sp. SDUM158017]
MSKPTVHDIAKEAGVSLATVDRVLNSRPGVRDATIARVQGAVDRLGYVRDTTAANLARQRQYRFAYLLPEGPSQFASGLKAALKEANSEQITDRVMLRVLTVPANDPNRLVKAIRSLNPDHFDGIAMMVPETPQVRDAVGRLKEAGLAVVAVVSDLPNSQRDFFVGINNLAAGRTAASLLGRFTRMPGEVLVVTNSLRSRDSLERRLAFDDVISERFPHLTVLPTIESFDNHERLEQLVTASIARRPNLRAAYSMGAGNAAVLNAVRKSGRAGDITVLAHELTRATREGLLDHTLDAVITQNVGHLVRSSIRVLRTLCDGLPIYEAQERVRIEIVLKENLPELT